MRMDHAGMIDYVRVRVHMMARAHLRVVEWYGEVKFHRVTGHESQQS